MDISIYKRKDGRWEGRIYESSVDNKRRYKAFFGSSREVVSEKISLYRSANTCTSNTVFSYIVAEWFNSIAYRVKESTIANYAFKAEKHILPTFGEMAVSSITQNDI